MGSKRPRAQPAEADAPPPEQAQAQDTEATGGQEDGHPSKKARVESKRSLFVRSLPPTATDETLTDFFSQHFPVKHATVILDPKTKTSRGYGFVTFTDADDAKDAKEKLHKQKMNGRPLILEIAEPRHRQGTAAVEATEKKQERQETLAEARKAPKLIVRNLPWSIKKSEQLSNLFRSYGKVKYADLPQHKGKLSGFGFVTLRARKNAEMAIEGLNGKVVDGRTLAVDWAVDKNQWEKQNQKESDAAAEEEDTSSEEVEAEEGKEADDEKEEDDDEDDDDDDMDADMKNFMKNHMQNLEDEDSNEDEDPDADEAESEEAPVKKTTDNSTTLFIRNLPFSTTDEQLKTHFEQFGPVRYARTVTDRATDRPAGTGFVCFVNFDDFKTCLKGAPRQQLQPSHLLNKGKRSILQDETTDLSGQYTIEGRILQVSQAVSKDEATRLAETGAVSRREKDKRRLYLLPEGSIPANSPLYATLSPAELQIREQSAAQRKKLIQGNPSLHLSLTRLAVRNIPRDLTAKDLKALARRAIVEFAKDVAEEKRLPLSAEEKARGGVEDKEAEKKRREKGKGIVKQAKIVFENRTGSKVAEGDGAGKSRGYGFVEYSSHRWALMGLRWLNGHALKNGGTAGEKGTGKSQRLIVEFAIENAQVVNRRKELEAKSRVGLLRKAEADGEDEQEQEVNGGEKWKGNGNKGANGRGLPRGKDFAVSNKGKWQQNNNTKNGKRIGGGGGGGGGDDMEKRGKGRRNDDGNGEGESGEGGSAKDALQQKIIIRKRMTRKKKAQSRG